MSRLDIELVYRGLYNTRSRAQLEIKAGKISCDGKIITKTGYEVNEQTKIEIVGEKLTYVSRGALKLEKAINEFNISLKDKIMIDIGSSTGGFSDFAIQNGISKIYAIDVGTDQFDKELSKNPKIHLYENTDFRKIDNAIIEDATFATIDVSFISITKIIDKLASLDNIKEVVALIKPQFEVGKEISDKFKGVIKDEEERQKAIEKIKQSFFEKGYKLVGITTSPIKGGDGNIEYLAYFKKF